MIGIFDSGFGGLSIYRGIKLLLPKEKVIYLADQANFPYGEKDKATLRKISERNCRILVENGAKIIVVACNTATVNTIDWLRERFSIPLIGVVPVVKTCASVTRNGKIGILATRKTIKSNYQKDLIKKFCSLVETFSVDGSSLVDLVENNFRDISDKILLDVVEPFLKNGVDTVALGCTHYHFLLDRFQKLIPRITFLSSEGAVARQVKRVMEAEDLLGKGVGKDIFLTTRKRENLYKFLKDVLDIETSEVYKI